MITLQDCIGMCDLSEAEILAIAEHEHVPEIVAVSLAQSMLKKAKGVEQVRHMIIDDIRASRERGDMRHAAELLACLRHFLETHPEAVPNTV
jgi:DNA repair protein RadC